MHESMRYGECADLAGTKSVHCTVYSFRVGWGALS